MTSVIPDVIYHYTTIPAFKSMVRHNQLWLTHYKHVNDDEELTAGLKIVEEKSVDYLSKCGEITRSIRLPESAYDQYLMCFCARNNNPHLWEEYAGYSGVVIGFDRRSLENSGSVRLVPMSYDLDSFSEMCTSKVQNLLPVSQDHEDSLKDLIRKGAKQEEALEYLQEIPNYKEYRNQMSYLNSYATLIKNPKWNKEEEIRLVYWPFVTKSEGASSLDIQSKLGRPRALLNFQNLPIVSVDFLSEIKISKNRGILKKIGFNV